VRDSTIVIIVITNSSTIRGGASQRVMSRHELIGIVRHGYGSESYVGWDERGLLVVYWIGDMRKTS